MQIILKTLILLLIIIPSHLLAEVKQTVSYDIDTCIKMALSNNPNIKSGFAALSYAKMSSNIENAKSKPSLTMEGNIGYFAGQPTSAFGVLSDFTEENISRHEVLGKYYQATIGFDVPIYREGTFLFQTPGTQKKARLMLSMAESEIEVRRRDIAFKVIEAYINGLKLNKAVYTYKDIVDLLEIDVNLSKAKFDQELVSKNDLLISEVRSAIAKRELSKYQMAYQRNQMLLSSLIGLKQDVDIELQDIEDHIFTIPSLETLIASVEERHPRIKIQDYKILNNEEEMEMVRSERYPSVSLLSYYEVASDFTSLLNNQWASTLNVRLPLYDFGLVRNKIAAANASVIKEKENFYDIKQSIEQDIRNKYFLSLELSEQIKLLEKQIEQLKETLKVNHAMFQQGLLPMSTMHDSETTLLKLHLEKITAEYDLKQTYIQLKLENEVWDFKQE